MREKDTTSYNIELENLIIIGCNNVLAFFDVPSQSVIYHNEWWKASDFMIDNGMAETKNFKQAFL